MRGRRINKWKKTEGKSKRNDKKKEVKKRKKTASKGRGKERERRNICMSDERRNEKLEERNKIIKVGKKSVMKKVHEEK